MKSLLPLLLLAAPITSQLSVTSVDPARNTLSISTATRVTVSFDAAVDATTVDDSSFKVFGHWSGVRPGTYAVSGADVIWSPDLPFFPGEMVSVSLSRNIKAAGGAALDGGNAFYFWTRSNPGPDTYTLEGIQTTRLPGEGLIQSYGIHAADLDRDGSPDFSIPNEVADDVRVFRNDGCGNFGAPEITTVPNNSTPSANEVGDFNGDGYVDFAVANISGDTVSVLRNDGIGSYLPSTTYPSGNASRGVAVLDIDADGHEDLAVALRSDSRVALHRNLGDGNFAQAVKIEAGVIGETSIIAVDADGDGRTDLFVGGYDSETLACLRNTGVTSFTTTDTEGLGGRPWMLTAGDIDGDGNVDAASCNSNDLSASIVRGDGAGGFFPSVEYSAGFFPLAVDIADTDGDGDLDLVISNYGSGTWTYRNNDGSGGFGPATTLNATFAGSCMTLVDDDRDGDLDLIGLDEISDEIYFYRQDTPIPDGVQASQCTATLRVNNMAGYAGFGLLPPHPISLGERAFLGITTTPGTGWIIAGGSGLMPGAGTPWGRLNLLPAFPLVSGTADSFGESQVPINLPPTLTPGSTVALQGFTFVGSLTNPETATVLP